MKARWLASALLLASGAAHALFDRVAPYPTNLAGWTISARFMDTGPLRSCTASGQFGDLTVNVGNDFGALIEELSVNLTTAVQDGSAPPNLSRGAKLIVDGDTLAHLPAEDVSYAVRPNGTITNYQAWFTTVRGLEGRLAKARSVVIDFQTPKGQVDLSRYTFDRLVAAVIDCRKNADRRLGRPSSAR